MILNYTLKQETELTDHPTWALNLGRVMSRPEPLWRFVRRGRPTGPVEASYAVMAPAPAERAKATVQNKLAIRPRWHPAGRRRGDPALPCDIRPVCLGPGCTPLLARRAPPRPQLASWFCTVA